MKITLTDYTQNPVQKIGRAAAICYDGKTDLESNTKRTEHCQDKGHLTVNRFAYATFLIEDISRVCSHQLVRTAHCGFLQQSQRYVEQVDIEFIEPNSVDALPPYLKTEWFSLQQKSQALYYSAISNGMKKEDARYILLQSCATSLYMTANFQTWKHFLKERTAKAAQWEIREVALEIERQLKGIAPEVF
jgi:thymidylate synthase (FAD)